MEGTLEKMKKKVAFQACSLIDSNMKIGLGTGTTVKHLVDIIGIKLRNKEFIEVTFVCSSLETEKLCTKNKIPFVSIEEVDFLDIYIDGADEITAEGFAIKGLGGALTREKILRDFSNEFIVIVTSNKLVKSLGQQSPVPIEIIKFGYSKTVNNIKNLNLKGLIIKESRLRRKNGTNEFFITDNDNFILDLYLSKPLSTRFDELEYIDKTIKSLTGVVETGLFLSPADIILVGEISDLSIKEIKVSKK